jgi:hypothetical protein
MGLSFCIQDPNIEDLIAKIVSTANKECLFENIIQKINLLKCYKIPSELFSKYTHSYELTYSSGAYTK